MRKKIILSLIIVMIALTIGQASYAAVEIVPSKAGTGKDAIVNTTVSNSYLLCQGMKNTGGSLKGTTVDPHLATNKDWGAVSYLSNSIYGTNTQGGNTGIQVTIDGVKYYSTTTNITGVMNWGSNPNVTIYTQTAGLISNYNPSTSTVSTYVTELYTNKDTKYVDYVDPRQASQTLGMAMKEVNANFGNGTDNNCPVSGRQGLRSGSFGWSGNGGYGWSNGSALSNVTFRPVIWN